MAEGKRLYEGRARDGGGGALKANGGGDGRRKGRIIREFCFLVSSRGGSGGGGGRGGDECKGMDAMARGRENVRNREVYHPDNFRGVLKGRQKIITENHKTHRKLF